MNMIARSGPAFAAQAERIGQDLKQGLVIESDETGLRVAKVNRWLWVFHHGASALVLAAMVRRTGKAAVLDFLGDWRPDYWLSDRYGAQTRCASACAASGLGQARPSGLPRLISTAICNTPSTAARRSMPGSSGA